MDDKKLRALLTAVQCGSFGKATAQLGYTQSAMTHLVNKLEAELGCTLLSRSSHGVRLSEEGEHLLPYMQDYLRASDALRQEAALQGESHNHVLRIGCFASIARARLPALLAKFRKLHPEIKIDVLVGGYELAAALEEERVQLALVEESCGRGFYWTPLTDAPLVAVVPPDFPWQEDTIPLERLLQETFLSCPEQYWRGCCRRDRPCWRSPPRTMPPYCPWWLRGWACPCCRPSRWRAMRGRCRCCRCRSRCSGGWARRSRPRPRPTAPPGTSSPF